MKGNGTKITALYCRLSQDDGNVGDSMSIQSQKAILEKYAREIGKIAYSFYVDDGYSGTNFQRPSFQRMIADIEDGKIDTVITKDLSRLGRNYLESGAYIEVFFPQHHVRYIAVNDGVDSEQSGGLDITPFKNILNEFYSRDISKKVKSGKHIRALEGKFMGTTAPFGYRKDPQDKNHLIVDETTAPTVRLLFSLALEGYGTNRIGKVLYERKIPKPSYYKQEFFSQHDTGSDDYWYDWKQEVITRILRNEVYKGTLVQGKHTTPNHKVKKLVDKPEEEWVRIEKNHTPIIGERDFALVQKLLGMDTRTSPYETEVYVLSGIAVCGDCGAPMIKRDVPAGGKVYSYYICSRNNATKECSTHRIPREKLESLVLGVLQAHIQNILDMKRILAYVDTVPFQELDIQELENRREAKEQEIQRCREMRNLLYEDLKEGVVSKEDYAELYEGYNAKRRKAEEAVRAIQREIKDILESNTEKYQWLEYFTEHQNIDRLTRTAVVELVDRVKVFDRKHIEVVFQFDDCYQSMLKQIATTGCAVSAETEGRKEVV